MSWNRENGGKEKPAKKARYCFNSRKLMLYCLLGLVVLLGIGWGVRSFICGKVESPETPEIEMRKPPRKQPCSPLPTAENVASNLVNVAIQIPPKEQSDTLLSSVTNSSGRIVEQFRDADGRSYKVRRRARPPLFKYTTDNVLSMLLTQRGSGPIPPIPYTDNMDKIFLESLKEPVIIDKDAPFEIQERQRIVREARMEVKALMDQGLSFREIAAEHESLMNKNAAIRAEALAALKKECDKGDSEGTKAFLDKINKTLENMGVDPISMPTHSSRR